MPHVKKFTQAKIGFVLSHNFRSKQTVFKSVDTDLSDQNEYFVNTGEGLEKIKNVDNKVMYDEALRYEKKLLDETPHVNKSDLVTSASWVITCPKSLPREEQQKFLYGSIQFVSKRYGEKNIISASIHNDEPGAMPHVHIVFVPVDKRGRICAKKVLTRKDLQTWHPDLEKYTSVVLGHEVKIMREADEKQPNLPMSQFKAETEMRNAQNLLLNARREAEALARDSLSKLDDEGLLGRFRDNRPLVREAIKNASTAKALVKAENERRNIKLEKDRESFRRQSCLMESRELRLEVERNDFEAERQRVEEEQAEREKQLEERRLANEKAEKEVARRLSEAQKLYDQSCKNKADAEKARAEALAKERKLQDDRKQLDLEKLSYESWKKIWSPIESANKTRDHYKKLLEAEQKKSKELHDENDELRQERYDLKTQISKDCQSYKETIDKINAREEKKRLELTKDYDNKLFEKNKLINGIKTQIIPELQGQIKSANDEKRKLVDENEKLQAEVEGLKTTLVKQKKMLDCSMSEGIALTEILDNKSLSNQELAIIKAYGDQTVDAFKEAGKECRYMPYTPTPEKIRKLKLEIDRESQCKSKGMSR